VRYGLRIEAESASEMMRRVREAGFGKEVKERIIIGTYVLSSGYYDAFYTKAHKARTLMKTQFREMFSRYDALLLPTSPTTAFKIGEFAGDPMALKIADYCTIPANLGGFPAISINAGYSDGLPVGLQLVCDSFCEQTLFGIALLAESVLGAPKMPELVT
jgi:aspartyl-tRNA(Asn)/glutamyl-tRNA(Gln) amidotransferase subunit A